MIFSHSRNDLFPLVDFELRFYVHVGRDLPGDVDLETDQFTGPCLDCPRNKFCDAEPDRSSFENVIECISVSQRRKSHDKKQQRVRKAD
jgi:hypothetical protein